MSKGIQRRNAKSAERRRGSGEARFVIAQANKALASLVAYEELPAGCVCIDDGSPESDVHSRIVQLSDFILLLGKMLIVRPYIGHNHT